MREPLKVRRLGGFLLKSGHLRVTDPCTTPGLGPLGVLDAVPGRWQAYVQHGPYKEWGIRTWELRAAVLPIDPFGIGAAMWKLAGFSVETVSGQCGLVDDTVFPAAGFGDDPLYEKIVRETENPDNGALLPFGVFTSSGRGDGTYDVYTCSVRDGKIDAVRIVYLESPREEYLDEAALELAGAGD